MAPTHLIKDESQIMSELNNGLNRTSRNGHIVPQKQVLVDALKLLQQSNSGIQTQSYENGTIKNFSSFQPEEQDQ